MYEELVQSHLGRCIHQESTLKAFNGLNYSPTPSIPASLLTACYRTRGAHSWDPRSAASTCAPEW